MNIEVVDRAGHLSRTFDTFHNHYENFRKASRPRNIDLLIDIGQFKPHLVDYYQVGHDGPCFNRDMIYVPEETHKGARWSFQVEGVDSATTNVRIDSNTIGRMFVTGNVIDFMIHLKLLQKNCPIIHASAVSLEESGILFSSVGGGGKTTTAIHMTSQGFDFLGDNFVIVEDGSILGFPTSLSIFTYNLTPRVENVLLPREKLEFEIKKLIYRITGERAKFFMKINPNRLINRLATRARFKFGFFLIPGLHRDGLRVEECSRNTFVEKVVLNHRLEFGVFDNYLGKYSVFFPSSPLSAHWSKYATALEENLPENAQYYLVFLPAGKSNDLPGVVQEITNLRSSRAQ